MLATLGLTGCGLLPKTNKSSSQSLTTAAIEAKRIKYCELTKAKYESQKYMVDQCDGAGFTSLYSIGCPENGVDLSVFKSSDGRMHRSPDHTYCWDYSKTRAENAVSAHSSAGYSKDHVLMRLLAAYEQKDLTWIDGFRDYLSKNSSVFCDGKDDITYASKCIISAGLRILLDDASKKLKSEAITPPSNPIGDTSGDALPSVVLKAGFLAHLDVVAIYLSGRIYGAINDVDKEYLRGYAARETKNGLYNAVASLYGVADLSATQKTLEDTTIWPDSALPTSANYCTSYLYQRDITSTGDWNPCPSEGKTYDAVEYVFSAAILKN